MGIIVEMDVVILMIFKPPAVEVKADGRQQQNAADRNMECVIHGGDRPLSTCWKLSFELPVYAVMFSLAQPASWPAAKNSYWPHHTAGRFRFQSLPDMFLTFREECRGRSESRRYNFSFAQA